jgi:hypothetical protein
MILSRSLVACFVAALLGAVVAAVPCSAQGTQKVPAYQSFTSQIYVEYSSPEEGRKTFTGMHYRDEEGRLRTEYGDVVLISDRVARTTTFMWPSQKRYRTIYWDSIPTSSVGGTALDSTGTKTSLGTRKIEGFLCDGVRIEKTATVNSKTETSYVLTTWVARQERNILEVSYDDGDGTSLRLHRSNIQVGGAVDNRVFQVPTDYEEAEFEIEFNCRIQTSVPILELNEANEYRAILTASINGLSCNSFTQPPSGGGAGSFFTISGTFRVTSTSLIDTPHYKQQEWRVVDTTQPSVPPTGGQLISVLPQGGGRYSATFYKMSEDGSHITTRRVPIVIHP